MPFGLVGDDIGSYSVILMQEYYDRWHHLSLSCCYIIAFH